MPSACQGDESLGQHVEGLVQSRKPVEVGLLIGRTGSRAIILSLLPTPHQGGRQIAVLQATEDQSTKKQKKVQQDVLVQLNIEAIVEHATQIAAVLPGGITALGMYFYGPEAAFTSASIQLCKSLDDLSASSGNPADKLLTISSQTRKFLCKQRPPGSASTASLAVCDFKLMPCLLSFMPLECSHNVSLALPVLDSTQALYAHVEAAIASETQRIRSSVACHESSTPSSSTAVGDMALASNITFVSPPPCCHQALPSSADQEATVSGRVLLEGTLSGHAQVHKKDTWAAAVDMLKDDLVASLQARMDIVMAEAEDVASSKNAADAQSHALLAPAAQAATDITFPLPCQLKFSSQLGNLFDYQAAGESAVDVANRVQGLLGNYAQAETTSNDECKAAALHKPKALGQWVPCPTLVVSKSWAAAISIAVGCASSIAVALAAVAFTHYSRQ